jgi:hypothetical protein
MTEHLKIVFHPEDSNQLSGLSLEDFIFQKGIEALGIFMSESDLHFERNMKIRTRELTPRLVKKFEALKR